MEDIKLKILTFFKDLDFEEGSHMYNVNGVPIVNSVSGLIKHFTPKFDKENISLAYANKHGLTQEEVLKRWSTVSQEACDLGHKTHLFGELYPFNRDLEPKSGFEEAIVKFWNDLPDFIVPVIMECRMYHKELMYAGTADILCYNTITNEYIILDYKTNKDLFKNFKEKKLLKPFDNLLDNPFNKYQLQLSFYQILIEQIDFIKISSRKIIWIKPNGNYQLYDTENYTEQLKQYYNNDNRRINSQSN